MREREDESSNGEAVSFARSTICKCIDASYCM